MTRRILLLAASVLGLAALPSALEASSDYTCTPNWKLDQRQLDCSGLAMLSPGNDTRINLLFLMRDRGGIGTAGLSYRKSDYGAGGFGHTFFDWKTLRDSYYPAGAYDPDAPEAEYVDTSCGEHALSTLAFLAALGAAKTLPAAELDALTQARAAVGETCRDPEHKTAWPSISSASGKEFLAYLQGADAVYGERWGDARAAFASLGGASDPWVRETAAYMTGRIALRAAQADAFNEWGDFAGPDKVDKALVAEGKAALERFLKAWPKGLYAESAQGLLRRAMWLGADWHALGAEYERLAASVPADTLDAPELVEEIDNKFLTREASAGAGGPLLLTVADLLAMRQPYTEDDYGNDHAADAPREAPKLTAEALAAQEAAFASWPDLYAFLQASHAFYVTGDYKRVLTLIPDDARQPSYGPFAFSRQVLRGMALAALKDPNEASFWLELRHGAEPMHQRQVVELALALNYERHGKLGLVFAKDSPVQDGFTRERLLQYAAGPDVLRAVAADPSRGDHERDVAAFTLLYKQLTRGFYSDFVRDLALVRPGASKEGWLWDFQLMDDVPAGLFPRGRTSDGYACPSIAATAQMLAANPASVKGRLCWGDFLRLNGFDGFTYLDSPPHPDELGGAAALFAGKPMNRSAVYKSVMDDKRASADDRAYALYRAVRCYAPAGNNSCGGDEVDLAVRKGWYNRLKAEYPKSPWARKLRFYW
ncbi:hypothetical protein [Novosphingobium sp.]|uniref:hypothetical protein n=1 Tax=Novosphingobium sp. TaxID=1874826 RepID=UPI0035AF8DE7